MSQRKKRLRIFLVLAVAIGLAVLVGLVVLQLSNRDYLYPSDFLAHVEQVEQNGVDESVVQGLGWDLAILGREDEVRRMDFTPKFEGLTSTVIPERLELSVVPWREGLREIAANHRLILIMEDHFVSEHREWIGGTLETFAAAGFRHYAAEAIRQSDSTLQRRGYPSCKTGLYVSEPKFGNTIRRALRLNFQVSGYDFEKSTADEREEFAATELAKVFHSDPDAKLVVHAGFAHV
jgi:hypothetical protein